MHVDPLHFREVKKKQSGISAWIVGIEDGEYRE